jgi:hypothetical protein
MTFFRSPFFRSFPNKVLICCLNIVLLAGLQQFNIVCRFLFSDKPEDHLHLPERTLNRFLYSHQWQERGCRVPS